MAWGKPVYGEPLTARQEQIHDLMVNTSLTRQEIADKIFVSKSTVVSHSWLLKVKKGCKTRVELIMKHHNIVHESKKAA
jgi:DNA-binding CsgD family transcriptional regulator